jgi:acid phosphatase
MIHDMRLLVRTAALFLFAFFVVSVDTSAAPMGESQVAGLRSKINHIIVIYEENWSFDGLYSQFPGANGARGVATPQLQCPSGTATYTAMPGLPPALIRSGRPTGPWPCGWQGLAGGQQDPHIPIGMPLEPYDLTNFIPTSALTGDLWHIFWHEQLQIDNGVLEPPGPTPMDKFAAYGSNPGLTFGYYNATHLPEGVIAQRYTLADDFFHSAFGGSYLSHQWLICACTPVWNQPLPQNAPGFIATWDSRTKTLVDGNLSTMPRPGGTGPLWVVNTTFTENSPHPAGVKPDELLKPIPPTQKTIGDLLTDHSPEISWKWYSGGWDLALAHDPRANGCPNPSAADPNPMPNGLCFQYHHQSFAYFARWGTDGSPAKAEHLQDETKFFSDLQNNTLPSVVFVKPVGVDNEHPNYSTLLQGGQHLQKLIAAVCASSYWKDTAIIVTYDENGGRWDHVAPPKIDEWGPGTRVPAIIISPYAKPHFVDHTEYETVSILALIEKRWGLPSLNARDGRASPLLGAFDFSQAPLACHSS